jgi:hypothetical protein
MTVLMTATAAVYALLLLWRRNAGWLLLAIVFIVLSGFLRYSIEVETLKDFSAYFSSFLTVKYDEVPVELLIEPYRLVIFRAILLFADLDDLSQITAVYYVHFAIVTAFFVWLAWLKDVTFEVKLILFLAFYPSIAFVWLRAGMAYVIAGYLFYTFVSGKWRVLHFLVPTVHVSALPFLGIVQIKNMKLWKKVAFVVVALIVLVFILESNFIRYLIVKLERYSETADRRTSSGLLLFHAANIFVFLYFAMISRAFRKNFVVLTLMAAYIFMYFLNPVTGLRMFPFVLIAVITERISFPRYQMFSLLVAGAYVPVYLTRFDQIFL